MAKQDSKKVLIIGAGPAGLSAARILSEQGFKVEVFEADLQVGGMSKSLEMFGQIVDIGPHRFFSKDSRLNDFWHAHTRGEYEKVSRLTRIFYNKKFFYYPLRGFDALFKLGFIESALCVLSYIKAKLAPFKGDSFESWVANAFGYRLYSIFFKGYTEKLWGIKCSELDSDFAAQRIKGLNLYEAIKSAFFGGGGKKHKTLVDEFSYPKRGCGVVYENMREEIEKLGGQVYCGVNVRGIITEGKRAVGIRTDKGEVSGDIVISTAPFSDMVCSLEELDSGVRELARGLKFRNTILVYVEVGGSDSSLGNHSQDFGNFGAVTTDKVAPTPKSPKNQQSNTAKQGEAAVSLVNTRIVGGEAKAESHTSSLRASENERGNPKSQADSMDCHADKSARNDSTALQESSQMSLGNSAESLSDFSGFVRENNSKILSEKSPQRDSANEAHLGVRRDEAEARRGDLSPKAELFKDNWIYVHSRDTHTGRITNFANWTKDLRCGRDSAILCLEYWANDDEPLWNLSEEELISMAKNDLLDSGLVKDSSQLLQGQVMKIHKSYPVYERGYKENLHRIYGALSEFKNLYFIGRNGSFKYNNQDHSILMGLLCADKILGKDCDLWSINTDYDYQEGGKSE